MSDSNISSEKPGTAVVFAADLGGTHLRAAIVDESGEIQSRIKQRTPQTKDPHEIVRVLVSATREGERQCEEKSQKLKALSVTVPGTVDVDKGVVLRAPNVPCLDGFHLASALETELKRKTILENDANAAAVGEMWRGAGRGHKTIFCVTLGTGVGGGIILNEKLWRGTSGSAAEIGHTCVDPSSNIVCGCGRRGCLEVFASGTAIVRLAREARERYPDSALNSDENLTAEQVYGAGLRGDQLALEVFRIMGSYLGISLANLINILNPEMIIIGGGVASGWKLFEPHMSAQIAEHAIRGEQVEIVPAECGDDAGLLGVARLGFLAE